MAAPMDKMRVLELYSGVGGMHFALCESGIQFEVVMAMDINTNANLVYRHNFPATPINASAIESLTVEKFESLGIDMILMSPPCQPFTRVGKQKDTKDVRTKSFLHVLELLKKSEKCPSYVLLENVRGFECSDSRMRLVETLSNCGYIFQELLLTPLQFGIPNSRLRYFLMAKMKPLKFCFTPSEGVMEIMPQCPQDWFTYRTKAESETQSEVKSQGQMCICRRNIQAETSTNVCQVDPINTLLQGDRKRTSENGDTNLDNCKRQKQEVKHSLVTSESCESKADENNSEWNETKRDRQGTESVYNSDCLQNYGENMRQSLTDDQKNFGPCLKLYHFLEDAVQTSHLLENYLVSEKDLKRFMVMDIVNPCSRKTCCFTKRYGHYIDGAGSLVQMTADIKEIEGNRNYLAEMLIIPRRCAECRFPLAGIKCIQEASLLKDKTTEDKNRDQWKEAEFNSVRKLNLRYFTPREISRLLCFPEKFGFPEGLTTRQMYMLLGNSLNVHIVSVLIRLLTEQSEIK